jgi:CMP-N,N'-diacetyllegionaminic acid synthase
MPSPNFTALVLARGGSKRIKRKNMQDLAGKPLLYWTLRYAQLCPYIENTIVSSDDLEILNYVSGFQNVWTIERPAHLASDTSTDLEAFEHCLTQAKSEFITVNDYVVHLRATNPFRKLSWMEDIIEKLLKDPEIDTVRSVELAEITPFKMWLPDDKGIIEPVCSVSGIQFAHSMPKQVLPKVYWQNAHLDIIRKDVLMSNQIVGKKIFGYLTPPDLPDIDLLHDLEIAREFFAELIDDGLTE